MPPMNPLGRLVQPLAWILISLCLIASPVLGQSLEVIDLKYRTAAEVIPVTKIDGRVIGSGEPGTVTRKLMEVFHRHVRESH